MSAVAYYSGWIWRQVAGIRQVFGDTHEEVRALVCTLVILGLAGCGAKPLEVALVSGMVTLDGAPVEKALVRFVPQEGSSVQRPVYAVTDAEGNYDATFGKGTKGVPIGTSVVQLSTGEEDGVFWQGKEYNRVELFPKDALTNFQTVEIKPGENTLNFFCETDGKKKAAQPIGEVAN